MVILICTAFIVVTVLHAIEATMFRRGQDPQARAVRRATFEITAHLVGVVVLIGAGFVVFFLGFRPVYWTLMGHELLQDDYHHWFAALQSNQFTQFVLGMVLGGIIHIWLMERERGSKPEIALDEMQFRESQRRRRNYMFMSVTVFVGGIMLGDVPPAMRAVLDAVGNFNIAGGVFGVGRHGGGGEETGQPNVEVQSYPSSSKDIAGSPYRGTDFLAASNGLILRDANQICAIVDADPPAECEDLTKRYAYAAASMEKAIFPVSVCLGGLMRSTFNSNLVRQELETLVLAVNSSILARDDLGQGDLAKLRQEVLIALSDTIESITKYAGNAVIDPDDKYFCSLAENTGAQLRSLFHEEDGSKRIIPGLEQTLSNYCGPKRTESAGKNSGAGSSDPATVLTRQQLALKNFCSFFDSIGAIGYDSMLLAHLHSFLGRPIAAIKELDDVVEKLEENICDNEYCGKLNKAEFQWLRYRIRWFQTYYLDEITSGDIYVHQTQNMVGWSKSLINLYNGSLYDRILQVPGECEDDWKQHSPQIGRIIRLHITDIYNFLSSSVESGKFHEIYSSKAIDLITPVLKYVQCASPTDEEKATLLLGAGEALMQYAIQRHADDSKLYTREWRKSELRRAEALIDRSARLSGGGFRDWNSALASDEKPVYDKLFGKEQASGLYLIHWEATQLQKSIRRLMN